MASGIRDIFYKSRWIPPLWPSAIVGSETNSLSEYDYIGKVFANSTHPFSQLPHRSNLSRINMSSESQVGFDVLPGLELLSTEKGLEEQCTTLQSVLDSLRPNAPSRQIVSSFVDVHNLNDGIVQGTVARGGRASSISTESGTLYDDVGIKVRAKEWQSWYNTDACLRRQ